MKTSLAIAALVLSALAALNGCGGDETTGVYSGPPWPTACAGDSDCGDGQICSERYGICADRMPSGSPLTFAVSRAPDSGIAGDQFMNVECRNAGLLDLTTTPTAVLTGTLTRTASNDGTTGALPAGRLVAEAAGIIPGLRFRHESTRISADDDWTWTMKVLPDVNYQVTFLPEDPVEPPVTWPVNVGMSGSTTLVLPASDTFVALSGMVRHPSGESRLPLAGARVSATIGAKLVSTTTTDARGIYRLNLPGTPGQVAIRVTSGESNLVFADRLFTWTDVETFAAALPTTRFLILDVEPVPESVTITLYVVGLRDGGARVPMAGTRLYIHGDTGYGTISLSRTIDSSTFTQLTLPKAVYTIDVVPPGWGQGSQLKASQFSVARRVVDLKSTEESMFAIEVPQRPTISGRIVYSGTAEAVEGAHIMFGTTTAALQGAWTDTVADIVHEAVSNANGEFSVHLDQGQYAMFVEPPWGSRLAPASWPSVFVMGMENIQIALNDGYLVQGTVTTADGTPLKDALLSFMFPCSAGFWDQWLMKDSGFARTFRQAGQAGTDGSGGFEAILPRPGLPVGAIGATFSQWQ
jgi:hypothetical protein